jgi:hypothetical protein
MPTNTAFEIIYNRDQAMLGGIRVFGFAARISTLSSCRCRRSDLAANGCPNACIRKTFDAVAQSAFNIVLP